MRDRYEAFDIIPEVYDDAFIQEADDLAFRFAARSVGLSEGVPGIFLGLLEAQRDSLLVDVDAQHNDLDFFVLVHDLRGMLDPFRPAHIGDVNEAIDPGLDLDEGAKRGQVPNRPTDARPRRVLLGQREPGVLPGLLHAEGDLLFAGSDAQDDGLDLVADGDQLRRVPNVARPAHLGDMDQPFDTFFELDERAVVRYRYDLAADAGSNGVLFLDILPRIRLELLETQRYALAIPVDVEDLHLDLFADIADLARVAHTAP